MGIWQCLQPITISRRYDEKTPTRMKRDTWSGGNSAKDSGIRCRKAPPRRPPALNPTRAMSLSFPRSPTR